MSLDSRQKQKKKNERVFLRQRLGLEVSKLSEVIAHTAFLHEKVVQKKKETFFVKEKRPLTYIRYVEDYCIRRAS